MGGCPSKGSQTKLTIINKTSLNIDKVEVKSCQDRFRGSLLAENMADYENIAGEVEEKLSEGKLSAGLSWKVEFSMTKWQCFLANVTLEFQDKTREVFVVFARKGEIKVLKRDGIRDFSTQNGNNFFEVTITENQEEMMKQQEANRQREAEVERQRQQEEEKKNATLDEAAVKLMEEGENLARQGKFRDAAQQFEAAKRWARSDDTQQKVAQNLQKTAAEILDRAWSDEQKGEANNASEGFEKAQEIFSLQGFLREADSCRAKIEGDRLFNEGTDLLKSQKVVEGLEKLQESERQYESALHWDSRIEDNLVVARTTIQRYRQSSDLRVNANRNKVSMNAETNHSFSYDL